MTKSIIHIDIETYCEADLTKVGVYRYAEDASFEILMIAYAIDDEPVKIVDLKQGEKIPTELHDALLNDDILKVAHNANFERVCLRVCGYDIAVHLWRCTAIMASYAGLPRSLGDVSKILNLDNGKMTEGKDLIKLFSVPCKPTIKNGGRTRNLSEHEPDKWQVFKDYCVRDVEAEREICHILRPIKLPNFEWRNWFLDQEINDRGVQLDTFMVEQVIKIDEQSRDRLLRSMQDITGLANPNSNAQLLGWLRTKGVVTNSLTKDRVKQIIESTEISEVKEVLKLRQQASKTSNNKYYTMQDCVCFDDRARGLFQHYGASRTGRSAGRLIQLQNLPRSYEKDIDTARAYAMTGDYDFISGVFDNVPDILSQLIRTSIAAKKNHTLVVCDFSAIEARVLAWLANEKWRLDVFASHGKIYEASAAMMFGVPIEKIGKGSDLRQKGKVAELALGYQGGAGALVTMGADKMGLSEQEMKDIVYRWREANKRIKALWYSLQESALECVEKRRAVMSVKGIVFRHEFGCMTIQLPSGRKLFYRDPTVIEGAYGAILCYYGQNQTTGKWEQMDTYGGKLTENITQAIARDLLFDCMREIKHDIIMHVHDEVVVEVEKDKGAEVLKELQDLMSAVPKWAEGLPLKGEGFVTDFYKKD